MLHCIERHLDALQYKHILKTVMVPSIRLLYPNRIIQFQQNHSSIHDSNLVQKWLLVQADVELGDWPPWAYVMNPIDSTCSEVKKTMQTSWPVLPPKSSDSLWTILSENWELNMLHRTIKFNPCVHTQRNVTGEWSSGMILKIPGLENSPVKD
jgi:hypothetical protein